MCGAGALPEARQDGEDYQEGSSVSETKGSLEVHLTKCIRHCSIPGRRRFNFFITPSLSVLSKLKQKRRAGYLTIVLYCSVRVVYYSMALFRSAANLSPPHISTKLIFFPFFLPSLFVLFIRLCVVTLFVLLLFQFYSFISCFVTVLYQFHNNNKLRMR